jgi:hypothetical protein
MARVTQGDVQVYLDVDLFPIPGNDTFPEEQTFADMVFARLGQAYDTTAWLTSGTTPALVRRILAMLIAANRYNKKHAEDDDAGNRYAYKLENRAWELVNMIVSGQALLYDGSLLLSDLIDPKFWPDDTTGAVAIYDALGHFFSEAGSEDIKFRMGASF